MSNEDSTIGLGALVGGLLIVPMVAVMYLATTGSTSHSHPMTYSIGLPEFCLGRS